MIYIDLEKFKQILSKTESVELQDELKQIQEHKYWGEIIELLETFGIDDVMGTIEDFLEDWHLRGDRNDEWILNVYLLDLAYAICGEDDTRIASLINRLVDNNYKKRSEILL